jgi:hypothetical protein
MVAMSIMRIGLWGVGSGKVGVFVRDYWLMVIFYQYYTRAVCVRGLIRLVIGQRSM